MDVSDRDDCVKEEWSALLKPKGAFDSVIGNYKCCLMEDQSKQVSDSNPLHGAGWLGASCGPGKHLEALQLCTEGLGFESSDETETDAPALLQGSSIGQENVHNEDENREEDENESEIPKRHEKPAACSKFPPPLPSIARNNQAGVFMKSFKKNGRFVLQEVKKLPSHEVLHAWRGDGRLKLHFVHKDDHPNADCQRI